MADYAILGLTIAIVCGIAFAAYSFWKRRDPARSFLLFFLPVLAYLLWHFSAEAYAWGAVWEKAQRLSNSADVLLQTDMVVALIDIKILMSVFLLLFWAFIWLWSGRRK